MSTAGITILSVGFAIWAFPVSASAASLSFDRVIVFGDSLSDSGNVAIVTAPTFQQVPFGGLVPTFAYENGRFTNGATWVEDLAGSFGLSALPSLSGGTNFAFGGAKTEPVRIVPSNPPSLLRQFEAFQLKTGRIAPSNALYVIWGGANNLFDAAVAKQAGEDKVSDLIISKAVSDITTIVRRLTAEGAIDIVVPNMVNLGLIPLSTRGTLGLAAASMDVSLKFNAKLRSALSGFRSNPNLNLIEVDAFGFLQSIVASPSSFGLKNIQDPCVDLTGVCSNPNEYLFYDGIHPTATFHMQFAKFVRGQITGIPDRAQITSDSVSFVHANNSTPIPDPSKLPGVIASGLLLGGSIFLRHKSNKNNKPALTSKSPKHEQQSILR
ncbi:SGNH/GDSL hydrolase family protein [Tumidithrix helvetica]|uniref:SGNH/GDSL hydrolase family protein n=1 Tax=Tumidithrix helvetica TaxID=3457545 RepID=UPI003CC555BF